MAVVDNNKMFLKMAVEGLKIATYEINRVLSSSDGVDDASEKFALLRKCEPIIEGNMKHVERAEKLINIADVSYLKDELNDSYLAVQEFYFSVKRYKAEVNSAKMLADRCNDVEDKSFFAEFAKECRKNILRDNLGAKKSDTTKMLGGLGLGVDEVNRLISKLDDLKSRKAKAKEYAVIVSAVRGYCDGEANKTEIAAAIIKYLGVDLNISSLTHKYDGEFGDSVLEMTKYISGVR